MGMSSRQRSKFDPFERDDFEYAKAGDHSLLASTFRPTKLVEEIADTMQVPVLVFWHGGGFVAGDRLYEGWWPDWLIEYALSKDALIVAPDYRLMPEASGADILDDVEAFWKWVIAFLPSLARDNQWKTTPDLSQILCVGQSTGGCMAVCSALLTPDLDLKAVLSLYAPLYPNVSSLSIPYPRRIMGIMPPAPRQAEAKIRAYTKKTKGNIRTSGDPSQMWELLLCMLQQGRLPSLWHARPDPRLDAISLLRQVGKFPPLWLVHGVDDSIIPYDCSKIFLARLKEVLPDNPVLMSSCKSEHNFDIRLTLEEDWVKQGCEFLAQYW